jgi:RHS repeat-associated protein
MMNRARFILLGVLIAQSTASLMAQAPICDVICDPNPGSPNYGGAVAARPKPLNARGFSSSIQAIAGPEQVPMVIGSQSYNYAIPILSLPGRAGLDLNLNLFYNSRIWDIDTVNGTATFNADRDFPSYGFRLDFGFLEYDPNNDEFILTERDGTKRALLNNGGYNSTDGSSINYNAASKVLTYKNGTTVQFAVFPSNANLFRPVTVKTTNGNYLSITYVTGHDQFISTITDTLGRVITFNYDGSNRLSTITQALHPSGIKTLATFQWTTKYGGGYVWYNFSGLAASGAPDLSTALNVLSGCTYPNGTGYRFTYGDWGIINKIETLSSNGTTRSYISYNYPTAGTAQTDAPTYTQQTISPDGGTGNLSTWNYAVTKTGVGAVTSMAIADPNGNTNTTNLDPDTGLTSSLQLRDSLGNVLRTVAYAWTTSGAATVPLSVTTTLNDTGQQASMQFAYDSYGNATTVSEYDFGLILKRQTVTTYSTAYVTQHILNLPTQVLIKDDAGNVVGRSDFAYDTTSLTLVTGAAGHDDAGFGTGFTARGNLSSMTRYANAAAGSGGDTRTYTYDTLGNVRVQQLSCCNQKQFNLSSATQYSAPDSIVRGPSGGPQFTTSFTYNQDNGQVLSSTDENNQVINYTYDSMNRTTQVLLPPQPPPSGTRVQLNTAFDDADASPAVTKSSTADSMVTITTLDGLGHVMRVDNKNGTTMVSSVTYSYDKLWRRTQASNPFGPTDTVVNSSFSYDSLGRVTQVTPPSAGYSQYQYSGNAVTITDPAGKQRRSVTDALGRLVEVDEPGGTFAGSASGGTLNIGGTLRSQSGVGAAPGTGTVSLAGTNQCTPDFSVCDSGLIAVTVNGSGGGSVPYPNGDPVGFLAQYLTNSINQGPYVNATWNNNFYFPVITLTAKTTGSGTNYPLSTLVYSNDPTDFTPPSYTATASGPNLTGGSDGVTVVDSGTVTVTLGTFTASAPYSQSGNSTAALVATALVGTGPTGLNRAGSPVHATVNGASISFTYNTVGAAGNVGVTAASSPSNGSLFPGGSFSGSSSLTGGADAYTSGLAHPYATTYTYDVLGNLTAVSQAAGAVNGQPAAGQPRSYSYDNLSRITSATTPESGTVTTFYTTSGGNTCAGDPGLPCRIQDARGIVKTLTYDGINRPTGFTYSDGTASVTYQYDTGGASAFALDRLTKILEGPTNSQTFTYDNLGRITTVAQVIGTKTYNIQYAYNLASQLTSITYPSNRVVTQNYDAIGRLCAVGTSGSTCSSGTTYLTGLTYNAAREALGLTMGNGVQGTFTYNDHLQISTLRFFKGSTDFVNLAYDYTTGVPGNDGQIQAMHYYTSPGVEDLTKSENFTYDPWGRLSAAHTTTVSSTAGTWSLQWTYDRLGNRTAQTLVGGNVTIGQPNFVIDPNTNRITNSGYTYDAAGNMTHDATASYTYDGANRLTKINAGPPTYTYFGPLRIKKVVGSTTTTYIYSGSKPIAEYTGTSNPSLSKEYIYAGSQMLATIAGATTTYHHPDHLSNRAESNTSGTSVRTFGQFPFGEVWYETGTADKWKFTSYERDSGTGETGLDYAQFRYLSSGQGRFLSADLLGGHLPAPQSLNRYSYVANDPINLVDPTGMELRGNLMCLLDDHGDCVGGNYFAGCPSIDGFLDPGCMGGSGFGGDAFAPCNDNHCIFNADGLFHFDSLLAMSYFAANNCFSSQWDGGLWCGSGDNIWSFTGGQKIPNHDFKPWDMRARIVALLKAKNDCSDWFNKGTGSAPEIMSHVPILIYASKDSIFSPPDAHTDDFPSSPILVNDKGRFYSDSQNGLLIGGVYPPGSDGARMVILLHELAHKVVPPGFTHDGALDSPPGESDKNTDRVLEHCEKAIDGK